MTVEQRRKAMQSNRGRTKPEKRLAAAIWREGFRFLTADGYRARFGEALTGNPDIIFTRKHFAIFVDGCFWHGCRRCHQAELLNSWWQEKLRRNGTRDKSVTRKLRRAGWTVLRIWEHDLRSPVRFDATVGRIVAALEDR